MDNTTVLNLSKDNLKNSVRRACYEFFNSEMKIAELASDGTKRRVNSCMRKMQEVSRRHYCNEESLAQFRSVLRVQCPYINELLEQIVKLHVMTMGVIRNVSDCNSVGFDHPVDGFSEFIFDGMCKLIFHNINVFYTQYKTGVLIQFDEYIDSITMDSLERKLTMAYATLFEQGNTSQIIDTAVDNAIAEPEDIESDIVENDENYQNDKVRTKVVIAEEADDLLSQFN